MTCELCNGAMVQQDLNGTPYWWCPTCNVWKPNGRTTVKRVLFCMFLIVTALLTMAPHPTPTFTPSPTPTNTPTNTPTTEPTPTYTPTPTSTATLPANTPTPTETPYIVTPPSPPTETPTPFNTPTGPWCTDWVWTQVQEKTYQYCAWTSRGQLELVVDGEVVIGEKYTLGGTFCDAVFLKVKPSEVMLKVDGRSFGDCYETFLPETGGERVDPIDDICKAAVVVILLAIGLMVAEQRWLHSKPQ